MYAGEYWDKETGTYYLRARYYNPRIGRFTQEDTFRGISNDPLSLNLYVYCGNNPMMFIDPSGHLREAGYYTINGSYQWYDDPDAAEFGKDSDTYKIIIDLGDRWEKTNDKEERARLETIGNDARSLARSNTPYMYGNDKIMETLHANADYALSVMQNMTSIWARLSGITNPQTSVYTWFVGMACGDWDYKLNPEWQTKGEWINGVEMFNGVDLNKRQDDGGAPKNWYPWIYFEGQVMGADKFGNLNLGYVGHKMGYDGKMLINVTTAGAGDGYWIQYGIDMVKSGR